MYETQPSVTFFEALKLFFVRYADFNGRSRRSEYWWAYLAVVIISAVLTVVLGELAYIWSLATLVPQIAITIRRLHDIGKSGWWYLIGLIPLIGWIILLVYYCTDSEPYDNKWGANPKQFL